MRSARSFSVSTPFVRSPSTTPRTPRPRGVFATITSIGFAVAAKIVTISGTSRSARRTLIGYASVRKTTKKCPAPTANAFRAASSLSEGSFPSVRTRHGPDASQNATPKRMPGTDPPAAARARRSWRPALFSGSGGQLDEGLRGHRPSARPRRVCPRDGRMSALWTGPRRRLPKAFEESGRSERLVAQHEEVRGDQHEDLARDPPHRPVPNRDDLSLRLEFKWEPHPPARSDEAPHRAFRPAHDRVVERAVRRPDESVRHDLGRIRHAREDVVSEREAEREARPRVPTDAGEAEPDEPAVGDPRSVEVLHGPLQRAVDPPERR